MENDKTNDFTEFLLQLIIKKQQIHLSDDPWYKQNLPEIYDLLVDFEIRWNSALSSGVINDNPLHLCVVLGMMHQVLDDNNIAHKEQPEYLFSQQYTFEDAVNQDFIKYYDLLFANKAFASGAPGVLACYDDTALQCPLFTFLIPCYIKLYKEGKLWIKNFKEGNYPNLDLQYWNP